MGIFELSVNVSQYDFKDVLVVYGGEHNYSDIAAGENTDYMTFDALYRYAYLSFHIDGVKYFFLAGDFEGETLLPPGYHTYELNTTNHDNSSLEIKLVEEQEGIENRTHTTSNPLAIFHFGKSLRLLSRAFYSEFGNLIISS